MFAVFYWLLCVILYIISSPILIFISWINPKYKDSIPSRFFLKNTNFDGDVWIHACSLGEINSLENLIKNIKSKVIISTITNTGYNRAIELFGEKENLQVRFLPFEIFIPFLMPKNLKKLVVLEAELWYMLFFCAKRRSAKTILMNARISSKSFPKYNKIAFFYKMIFKYIDIILCQTEIDKERLKVLGGKNIEVFGNIKALNFYHVTKNFPKFDGNLIFAASTHKGEEEIVISSYMKVFGDSKNHRLIIAPRHPERFNEVWDLMQKYSLKSAKFSKVGINYDYEMILVDMLGEMINIYNIVQVVILGGSFVKVGGHNPLECAFFNTKILSGTYIFNQYALFDLIEGYKIIKANELVNSLQNLESLPNSYIKNQDSKLQLALKYIEVENGKSI